MKNKPLEKIATESSKPEVFADPTYDITFKMLFGSEQNKEILISLLNSLLGFKGVKEIKDVQININELPVIPFSIDKSQLGISSAVDVLCTTFNGQKIAIEMQRQKTKYFLSREQEYMAKLLVGQVKEGEGKLYHEKVLETYIIVITKENVFTGSSNFEKQKLFEIDVEPRIVQTNEPYPNNKMHWKFFELDKFKKTSNYSKINYHSDLKEQWLEFLIECNKQVNEPDRNHIIKKGYEIMKMSKWDADTQSLYWKQKQNELSLLEQIEGEKEEAAQQAFKEGEIKGKLKGEIKGEIKQIKCYEKMEIEVSNYSSMLNHIKPNMIEGVKNYINAHPDDTESLIGENLHLFEPMEIE